VSVDTADADPDGVDYWRDHPSPTEDECRELCEAWLAYQRANRGGSVDEQDPNWWAVEAAMDAEDNLKRILPSG
jgi:hypothetical protein